MSQQTVEEFKQSILNRLAVFQDDALDALIDAALAEGREQAMTAADDARAKRIAADFITFAALRQEVADLRAQLATAQQELSRIQQLARCFQLEDILNEPHDPSDTTRTLRAFELAATLRRQLVKAEAERDAARAQTLAAVTALDEGLYGADGIKREWPAGARLFGSEQGWDTALNGTLAKLDALPVGHASHCNVVVKPYDVAAQNVYTCGLDAPTAEDK